MRSSTSNSKKNLYRIILIFGCVFSFLTISGLFLIRYFPSNFWNGAMPPIQSDDPYLVMEAYTDQAPDLYREYYGFGPAIRNAQKADILIIGNSKPYFAFRGREVEAFERKTGLKVFNLAIPDGNKLGMTLRLIEKFRLHPVFLIVNESHYFNLGYSYYADTTMNLGWTQALSRIFEIDSSWALRTNLHHLFPRWGLGKLYGATPDVSCRSISNGCLVMENFKKDLVPVQDKNIHEETIDADELRTAMNLKKEVEANGTQIVLTNVPCGTNDLSGLSHWVKDRERQQFIANREVPYESIDQVADLLGVPYIAPHVSGLCTFDGIHMDEQSATKYATAFFNEMEKKPWFKDRLKRRK